MPRKLYRFGGMTFVLEADSPIADSPMSEPFRVGAGEPADHTVRLTFSDRVPDPRASPSSTVKPPSQDAVFIAWSPYIYI